LISAVFLAACSSGGGKKFPDVITLKQNEPVAQVLNYELVAGPSRFTFFILSADGAPVVDANARVTFYDLNDGRELKKSTVEAESVVPARDAGLTEQIIHTHTDGSRHVHVNAGDEIGVYTINATFDRPGQWGAEIEVSGGTPELKEKLQMRFDVLAKGTVPNVGDPAPRSDNLTVADVEDLTIIDTSPEPSPDMHTMSIADAIATGRPTVVLFGAPGYCSSQICGPEYEIMRKLYREHQGDGVNFVHVEFYSNPASAQRKPVPAAVEWQLRTEPWFFVIDGSGKITARFEGPTGYTELQQAIRDLRS
jgi:hypothetical protein